MKPQDFCRANIEVYCVAFLGALRKNPNFRNPESGAAAAEGIINYMFLLGLQSVYFRERIQKVALKEVNITNAAIKKVLPKYQESNATDIVPAGKPVEKSPQGAF